MSRRKQENPQPRKRLINGECLDTWCNGSLSAEKLASSNRMRGESSILSNQKLFNDKGDPSSELLENDLCAETELLQDTLTCGSCQKVFVLSEIVKFIQHKVHSCNKENILLEDGDGAEDREDPAPLVAAGAPSISAPICNRKGPLHQNHRNNRTTPGRFEPEQEATFFAKKDLEDVKKMAKEMPVIKQEVKDPALRCSPKIMVNAYTNTIITEPSTYTCSTCKQTFTSAWVLVQHAQHMHGMKIYLVTPYHGSRSSNTTTTPSSAVLPPSGPPPSLMPLPPVLPPCSSMNGPHHHFENHPALQLLRMPLGERQFPNNLFARPPSQDFRVDALAASSSNGGDFHHHRLPPPPALPPFEPHNPFMERALDGGRPRPPPMSLGFEPQMDFYSQRLRQLAGATSPTGAPSPRKPSPPSSFPHPPSLPSTPTSTPQPTPALNLHATPPAAASSASSTASSKAEGAEGGGGASPKLPKSWPCDFCGKSFRFESNLIVHRRSHTGERPYKCPVCTHSCTQASKLKRHMKTHEGGLSSKGASENTSPRSTPDSTSAAKDASSSRRLEDEDDASEEEEDGQTADNEEEEEDLDDDEDEEEEEDEMDEDEDLDDSMTAEDLSTRGPNSSTPVPQPPPKAPLDHNDNNSSNTISVSNGGDDAPSPPRQHSLLSEVMDKIGLSNIQQYNEAYKKALEESSLKNHHKEEDHLPPPPRKSPVVENGPTTDGHKNGKHNNNNNALVLHQHSMEFGHGFFGAFDYNHHHHHRQPFDGGGGKRLKLDPRDRDSLYAGLWHPSVVYDPGEISRHNKSSSSESALKSVTPSNMCSRSLSPRPGTSGGGPSATPLLLGKGGGGGKEQRRNDTCEFCGKVFKNCSNLTVHRRSHTGEKPYKCELCSYACAQSSKLTRHMKTHGRLGKDVYRCRFCDMPFSVPSTLEKHMRKCVVNQNTAGVTYIDRDSDSKDLT